MINNMIKKMVENPHPIYTANVHFWDFLLQSYEGGLGYTKAELVAKPGGVGVEGFEVTVNGRKLTDNISNCNLFMHKKERSEDFLRRIQMSYYYNFCAPIIDIYTNHLFKIPVVEEWGSMEAVIQRRESNIDLKGSSLNEFRMETSELSQLYGHVFVVTDSPRYVGEVKSEQDRITNDLFPYLTLYHPQNVLNWALDSKGAPHWVLLREVLDANVNPMAYNPGKQKVCQYRLWTREGWILFNEEYEQIDDQVLSLGKVPITCVVNKPSKKCTSFMGISELADIAFIARDIYNLCSELKEILRNQTFAFLALQGNPSQYDELSIGTGKGLAYPEGTNPPQYVSPDPAAAETIKSTIQDQIRRIFQLAKLEGGSVQHQSATEQSGVSKAWDFNETNSALSKKANHMEDGENKWWMDFAAWENKEFDGSVSYARDFNVKDLWDDLEEAEKAIGLKLGSETEKAIKKAIIKKRFERMPDKDLDALIDGIPETPAQPENGGLRARLRAVGQN